MLSKFLKARKVKAATPEQYYNVFVQSPTGHVVLTDMMKAHSVLTSTFVKGDPYETALNEGARNVMLRILTILEKYEGRFEK